MKTTLKGLNPPFRNAGNGLIVDGKNIHVCQSLLSGDLFPGIMDFLAAALDEKYERDFGEPLRWRIDDEYGYRGVRCPKCGSEYEVFPEDFEDNWEHCPHCSAKLGPPEGKEAK